MQPTAQRKERIRLAQIRVLPEKGDLAANHRKLMSILGDLARSSVDVVVTSECFLDGYVATEAAVDSEKLRKFAIDPSNDPLVTGVAQWAREASAWFILGCSRSAPDGVYNSALIFDRQGQLHGVYDKIHCQTHDRKFVPGRTLAAFDSDFGPFGVMICADRRWPETVRSLALQGARVLFNPTYGMHDDRNLRLMQTRSYESEVFIAFTHPRQSLVTDPAGKILCNETAPHPAFSITEIDLSEADRVRTGPSAHLRDRRPDCYTP